MESLPYDKKRDLVKLSLGPLKPNTTQYWYPRDTEEIYDSHLNNPVKRKILIEMNWAKDSINYISNDAGFRMDINMTDITSGECDFYLGCSHTFGIGLNLEDTWCWKMSKHRNLPCVNLGWPGGGIEAQYRVLKCWANILKPKRAYTLGYYSGRRELLSEKGPNTLGHWLADNRKNLYEMMINKDELLISSLRAFDAMRMVCIENNIELYSIIDFNYRRRIMEHNGLARDLMHNSPDWHSRIANFPDSAWERLA